MAIRPEGEESDGGAGGAVRTSDEGERIRAEKPDENVRRITDPRKPSEREVEDHNRTHLPYRNWCPHCVKAKGKDLDHRKVVNDERVLNEFSFDYCFPGNELGYKLTVLVGRERTTGMTMATVIPSKGGSGKFVADKVMEFLAECGNQSGDIIVKSDQEPAIAYLVKDIVAERGNEAGCRTIVEESPVRSHGSNGVVERAVQTIEGQIRVMKLALEDRIGRAVDAEALVVTFMAEYASYLLNRLEVGKDGKTAHERVKGKTASVLGLEFGEKLLWKRKPTDKMDKISSRWDHGVFVGVRVRSGEFWVATVAGVRKVRSVRRIPEDERWSEASVKWVKNVPWNLYKDHPDADGDIPEEKAVDAEPGRERRQDEERTIIVGTRQVAPRAFYIRKEDAEVHGYTRSCPGCSSWFRGIGRQPHTAECRARFAELMKEDAKFKNAEKRKKEFEEKVLERHEKKQKKRQEEKEEGQTKHGKCSGKFGSIEQQRWARSSTTSRRRRPGRRGTRRQTSP
jgi:hypothetical protein